MKSLLIKVFLLILLFVTWAIVIFHTGVFPKPDVSALVTHADQAKQINQWIDRSKLGIHQLVVYGNPYERGVFEGKAAHELMYREEKELTTQLHRFFPLPILFDLFELALIRWFWGIEKYFEPWMLQEIYGVSESASPEFNTFADPMTRQIAYHGLHEVGQMMVDQTGDDMGCTVVAIPSEKHSWMIGRNFDFEGGRIFDADKIMKWVFPDQGYAYLSVIWAGMVGAVTGVNEYGLYISINAAGSTDFSRYGTPSTLVLLKALQYSKTAEEAVQLIRNEAMFITDIFVVSDRMTGKLFRIEKSPKKTEVIELSSKSIVSNHLISKGWESDRINLFRKTELTSGIRLERGEALLKELPAKMDAKQTERAVLSILRDKGEAHGQSLQPGNRRAIDSLIATHSVIYNENENLLYVSQGPSLSGQFIGFDLTRSFQLRTPVVKGSLPRDPDVTDELYDDVKLAIKQESQASDLIRKGNCSDAETLLSQAKSKFQESYTYYSALGDLERCKNNLGEAKTFWKKAISLSPAYQKETAALERKIQCNTLQCVRH